MQSYHKSNVLAGPSIRKNFASYDINGVIVSCAAQEILVYIITAEEQGYLPTFIAPYIYSRVLDEFQVLKWTSLLSGVFEVYVKLSSVFGGNWLYPRGLHEITAILQNIAFL
jgi:hypothetical protein